MVRRLKVTLSAALLVAAGSGCASCSSTNKADELRPPVSVNDTHQVTSDFESDVFGALSAPWKCGSTGGGEPVWRVETYAGVPSGNMVLMQSGEGRYPWCVRSDVRLTNGFVEVSFKPIAGSVDMAAGVVWRWQDADNYYVVRANALEDNVRIYRVVDGDRQQFDSVVATIRKGEWATLRVNFVGALFDVFLNGARLLAADDEAIKGAGAVGVWTKADSVTAFDNLRFGGE